MEISMEWLFANRSDIVESSPDKAYVEEKLKVDRKKFEALIQDKDNDSIEENAETFFNRIMKECPTVNITWPLKLKSGTKSKKDPHVKISGNKQMVKEAKNKILQYLDPKSDKVTLKMDVDWTAHSHIIGKAGASIQTVMDTTGCHIHFPDANRTNTVNKSNQVSIAGTAIGVNEARTAIRQLIPILITFNLLFKHGIKSSFYQTLNQVIQLVQYWTATQITLRFASPNALMCQSVVVFVRGTYGKCNKLKLAIDVLSNFVRDYLVNDSISFNIETEISAQHHSFVLGHESQKLQSIMQTSGAVITFPDVVNGDVITSKVKNANTSIGQTRQAVNESFSRKTSVSIKGFEVEAVLKAMQYIQMNLPLSLTFDLKPEQDLELTFVEMLSSSLNISITIKPKVKQNTKSIWIKAAEKDAFNLFEARRRIIQYCERPVSTGIWSPIDLDLPLWFESSVLNKDDIFEEEITADKSFNRAPGAERFALTL